jgi:phosphoglycolate phosphatase
VTGAVDRPRWSHVLFDLDGTLADGRRGIVHALQHALAQRQIMRREAELLQFIGPPLQEVFAEGFGFAAPEVELAVAAYRDYYADRGIHEVELYAGIPALLARLRRSGLVLGVATSKPRVYAARILDAFGLTEHFSGLSGPELDGSRRHKPEVIEHVLAQLGAPARGDVVMVGDRVYDVEGARHSGIASITVGWGFGSDDELARARADHHAPDVEALGRLLA